MNNIADIYELSPMQQGMLFHTIYTPQAGLYIVQLQCTLHGVLDVAAFVQAWQEVVRRHAVLRTGFYWGDLDKPLQVVHTHVSLPWSQHDWRDLTHAAQQERLASFLRADRVRGFHLDQAPLMRCALMRVAAETHQFVWSFHHLLTDGWCASLVLTEVSALYEAFRCGRSLDLEPPRPYRDYITWLHQQDLAPAEAFWRQTLQGCTAPTPLGIDKTPGQQPPQQEACAEQQLQLSTALTAALGAFARQHHVTLHTLVQGAWALLLSRYSGEDDVLFGGTVSGRATAFPGVESIIGLCINTLPVRVHVSRESTLVPWLQRLQAEQVEREHYSYSPLVEIHGWSDVPRSMPLFESLVVFENYPLDTTLQERSGNVAISHIHVSERTNYPLTVIVVPGPELLCKIIYAHDRFETAAMARMAGHLQTLLEGMVANPQGRLSALPLLTEPERQQLLVAWNDTRRDFPQGQCLHTLFAAQVERTPDAVAVIDAHRQYTYRQLQQRATQLAHHLRQLGVGPEVLVGLCVERSLDMVVGTLAILTAGGAYVPLDPAYPHERLAFMLADSQARVLVTQQSLVEQLPTHGLRVLCLDTAWDSLPPEPVETPDSGVTATHLAYVIYTSGSTGQPKGVAIEHRSAVTLMYWARELFPPEDLAGVLASTSLCFDLSVFELFVPLSWGGKVILAKHALELPSLAAAQQVTLINTVPSAMAELLSVAGVPPAVRTVNLAGEPLKSSLVQQLYQQQTIQRVFDLYGPSEDTTYSTCALRTANGPATIGRPLANTQIYLLDQDGQPVPSGVPGELYIGGDGLARGYLNRPALTQEKFIPNPFRPEPGARLYRTGDLARYLPDGNIEFLGRQDQQVKIHGFRIELGEIEAVLSQHPAVRETVVVAREDSPDEPRLVAYLVAHQHATLSTGELRAFVRAKLPDYMIPAMFTVLDALPLTPNGKVDRRRLPAPEATRTDQGRTFVAPRDTLEFQLTKIWEDVLGVHPVGVQDDFFELGGHSLRAVRLFAHIEKLTGKRLPLATLLQGPTVASLVNLLRQDGGGPSPWAALVPIQPGGTKPPFFCVPGGGGNVIYLHALAYHIGPDQPFYGLQARGLDGVTAPHTRVEDLAAYYIAAIQSMQPQGPYFLGGHSTGSWVALEMAQQLQAQGQRVACLAVVDAPAPLAGHKPMLEMDEARALTRIARLIERWSGKSLQIAYEALRALDADGRLRYFAERLQTADVLPPGTEITQVAGLVQVFLASVQASAHYIPRVHTTLPITLFRAQEVHAEDAGVLTETPGDPTWGWGDLAQAAVEVHSIPGDHITMLTEPHVQHLAQRFCCCLAQAQAEDVEQVGHAGERNVRPW